MRKLEKKNHNLNLAADLKFSHFPIILLITVKEHSTFDSLSNALKQFQNSI